MNKRKALANVLHRTGLGSLLGTVESKRRQSVLIYAYHRILDMPADYHYDKELVSATAASFDAQMRWVSKNTTPLTFHDLVRSRDAGDPLPHRACIITFDDGFFDNYAVAFPILRKYRVPATFFVSTNYIGSGQTYWFDWLAHRVLNPRWKTLELESLDLAQALPDGEAARRQLVFDVLNQAKALSGVRQLELVDELLNHQRSHSDPQGECSSMPMDWDMIRAMSRGGMEIASHGVNHYMLAKLTDQQLAFELKESRKAIESETDSPVVSVAYPVGGANACDNRVFDMAKDSGYEYGCDYVNGINYWSEMDQFALSRKQVELHVSHAEFLCAANLPWLY